MFAMEKLYERHIDYLENVPMDYVREVARNIDWNSRLIAIKGPKGVGKSTIMLQYIKSNFSPDDRHVLYCSADSSYFTNHTLEETADRFVKYGGTHLFIDEIHKYKDWSREVKEIYDLHKGLKIVISGSSLLKLNDGDADLSRRIVPYQIPGLSYREYLRLEKGISVDRISLQELLDAPNAFCSKVKNLCKPLESFTNYIKHGYYPFYLENKNTYPIQLENVIDYIINVELTQLRSLEVGNTRKVKALLKTIAHMLPFEVDIAKMSKATAIQRLTTLKYLKDLEEAKLIARLFQNLNSITDLQKPDKIFLDNTNLMYVLSDIDPQIGTVRECFFCNQLVSAGHVVEYGGMSKGDFKIDGKIMIEVGGKDKTFDQMKGEADAYVAADDIDSAIGRKIPLWAFGFLY